MLALSTLVVPLYVVEVILVLGGMIAARMKYYRVASRPFLASVAILILLSAARAIST